MNAIERRLRALEAAVGRESDNSFIGQARRMHARGENIPCVIVQPGETVEEVMEREGIPDWMPYIARIIVWPVAKPEAPPADVLEAEPQDSDLKPRTRDPLPNGDKYSDDREDRYQPVSKPWMLWERFIRSPWRRHDGLLVAALQQSESGRGAR